MTILCPACGAPMAVCIERYATPTTPAVLIGECPENHRFGLKFEGGQYLVLDETDESVERRLSR